MEDERHKKEEEERRQKRKASKAFQSDAKKEKARKIDEHKRKVLNQQVGASPSEKPKKGKEIVGSKFQEIFQQRAQGFHIDFRFRNAPPRPPVGPTFVGHTLDAIVNDLCRQYKQYNAVEANYTWRLHTEPDLGVPLAPSAMDLKSYPTGDRNKALSASRVTLHPDDDALLNWKGSLGDTAADLLKRRQDRARAATRAAMGGKVATAGTSSTMGQFAHKPSKKDFSRVLDEDMQTWMKKTTYLSNDYSRKVHDFKSLAQTKQDIVHDLAAKQEEMSKRRSVHAIKKSFDLASCPIVHPTNKNLQPKSVTQLLPNVAHWGRAYTHVIIDKPPSLDKQFKMHDLESSIVAHVERKHANSRMTCQLLLPTSGNPVGGDEAQPMEVADDDVARYQAVQAFDLDVVPLKDEDAPHIHFCFWVDERIGEATYLPIASRVQLSSGRPVQSGGIRKVTRRALTLTEQDEFEELQAEVDLDLAEKHHISTTRIRRASAAHGNDAGSDKEAEVHTGAGGGDGDDGEGDFGDDDDESSDDEGLFGATRKTIVAEG